ncbi:MAG: FeoB-associated Cys-rich membrane protein [Clostridia bacterium]|nr:FeoB-associated Cys-rich membrane protein [Clostridia bacterium]
MENFIITAVIILIVGSACMYIYKAKKKGKKCIGCPESGCSKCSCSRNE